MSLQIYLDSADLSEIEFFSESDQVSGFTTNPSLMRKVGITDAHGFARKAVGLSKGKPISFEISSEEPSKLKDQALRIQEFGENVFVKIPIVDTKGRSLIPEINTLLQRSVKINVTAVFTPSQIMGLVTSDCLESSVIVSCFAGRIADTQRDPIPIVRELKKLIHGSNFKLLWASAREVLNVSQAEQVGVDIITLSRDLLSKLELKDKDLNLYSTETSQMFFRDASESRLHF